jgi:hypothetical protein
MLPTKNFAIYRNHNVGETVSPIDRVELIEENGTGEGVRFRMPRRSRRK